MQRMTTRPTEGEQRWWDVRAERSRASWRHRADPCDLGSNRKAAAAASAPARRGLVVLFVIVVAQGPQRCCHRDQTCCAVVPICGLTCGVGHGRALAEIIVGEAHLRRSARSIGTSSRGEKRIGGLRQQSVHAVVRVRCRTAVEIGLRLQIPCDIVAVTLRLPQRKRAAQPAS